MLKRIVLILTTLAVACSAAPASAASVHDQWLSGSKKSGAAACGRLASVLVRGVPVRIYDCGPVRASCTFAGYPYASNVGKCVASWGMYSRGSGRSDYFCQQHGRFKGSTAAYLSTPICDPLGWA